MAVFSRAEALSYNMPTRWAPAFVAVVTFRILCRWRETTYVWRAPLCETEEAMVPNEGQSRGPPARRKKKIFPTQGCALR